MAKQGKVWGWTEEIYNNGVISINYLDIKEGGYCSEHKHYKKSNIFYVLEGQLAIEIWREKTKDETILKEGQSTRIEPGVFHRFWALTPVKCIEIYEVELKKDDIERRTIGGKFE